MFRSQRLKQGSIARGRGSLELSTAMNWLGTQTSDRNRAQQIHAKTSVLLIRTVEAVSSLLI
jgi:hypothetical protein